MIYIYIYVYLNYHQLIFHISPKKTQDIHRCQHCHRPFRLNVPSQRLPIFPAPRFAGTLLVMKRRTAGRCVPGNPGKMAMSYEPRLHQGKLDRSSLRLLKYKTWSIQILEGRVETQNESLGNLNIVALAHPNSKLEDTS